MPLDWVGNVWWALYRHMELRTHPPEDFYIVEVSRNVMVCCDQMAGL